MLSSPKTLTGRRTIDRWNRIARRPLSVLGELSDMHSVLLKHTASSCYCQLYLLLESPLLFAPYL